MRHVVSFPVPPYLMVYRLTIGGIMDKVFVDRLVTVLFFGIILVAAIALHVWNASEYRHHCPEPHLTRLCVE